MRVGHSASATSLLSGSANIALSLTGEPYGKIKSDFDDNGDLFIRQGNSVIAISAKNLVLFKRTVGRLDRGILA